MYDFYPTVTLITISLSPSDTHEKDRKQKAAKNAAAAAGGGGFIKVCSTQLALIKVYFCRKLKISKK